MTYISEYFHRFAQQGVKELAARRAAKFVAFAKAINTRKAEYEARVRALLEWCAEKEKQYSEPKFGETLDDANASQAALKAYYMAEKPTKIAEKIDIETLFAEIQTELKVNDRPPYVPPEHLSTDALDSTWEHLSHTEKGYGTAARTNRFRFVRKEETKLSAEKIAEFRESFAHFDANKDDALDRMEFKAACGAMSVVFKTDAEMGKTFSQVAEGKNAINQEQYIRYMTQLQEDKDTPEQVTEAFKSLANDGDTITVAQLAVPPLTEDDAKFLTSEMPDRGGGQYDYRDFVSRNFVSAAAAAAAPPAQS